MNIRLERRSRKETKWGNIMLRFNSRWSLFFLCDVYHFKYTFLIVWIKISRIKKQFYFFNLMDPTISTFLFFSHTRIIQVIKNIFFHFLLMLVEQSKGREVMRKISVQMKFSLWPQDTFFPYNSFHS